MTLAFPVEPSSTALLVIDVQNDFCHDEGSAGKRGEDLRAIQAMVPNLTRFIPAARASGIQVVVIYTEHSELTDSPTWVRRHDPTGRTVVATCRPGTWGAELYGGLAPEAEDAVVVKHRYSAFIGTDLDLILRARGINTLLLTGVVTNVCVESTLRHGFMLGYRTILLEDGCGAPHQPAHEATIWNVQHHFGEVARMDEVLAPVALAGQSAR